MTSVTRMHIIRTDGKKADSASAYSTEVNTNCEGSKITIIGSNGEKSSVVQKMSGANGAEVYLAYCNQDRHQQISQLPKGKNRAIIALRKKWCRLSQSAGDIRIGRKAQIIANREASPMPLRNQPTTCSHRKT